MPSPRRPLPPPPLETTITEAAIVLSSAQSACTPGQPATLAVSSSRGTQLDWKGTWVGSGLESVPHGENLQKPERCSLPNF